MQPETTTRSGLMTPVRGVERLSPFGEFGAAPNPGAFVVINAHEGGQS